MPSSVPDFAELLGRCERSAVHLELRDSYAPTDRFEAWKRGERIDWEDRASWWHPYDQLIEDAVSRGVAIRRARVGLRAGVGLHPLGALRDPRERHGG